MADIAIKCPSCGNEQKVSEYATRSDVICASCGKSMEMPDDAKANGLRVKKGEHGGPVPLSIPEELEGPHNVVSDAPEDSHVAAASSLDAVYQAHEVAKPPNPLWGWLLLLATAGGLIGFQVLLADNGGLLPMYHWTRLIVGGLIYLMVIMVAFEDSMFQGLLALLIPPYAVIYAMVRLDSHIIRGLFFGLVIALGAELYYVRDHSFLLAVQQGLNNWIHSTETQIHRAGDAPVLNR